MWFDRQINVYQDGRILISLKLQLITIPFAIFSVLESSGSSSGVPSHSSCSRISEFVLLWNFGWIHLSDMLAARVLRSSVVWSRSNLRHGCIQMSPLPASQLSVTWSRVQSSAAGSASTSSPSQGLVFPTNMKTIKKEVLSATNWLPDIKKGPLPAVVLGAAGTFPSLFFPHLQVLLFFGGKNLVVCNLYGSRDVCIVDDVCQLRELQSSTETSTEEDFQICTVKFFQRMTSSKIGEMKCDDVTRRLMEIRRHCVRCLRVAWAMGKSSLFPSTLTTVQ